MTEFFRFPHTPHLVWLGRGQPRDDKLLTKPQMQALLASELIVEEKVDGTNLGLSVDEHGALRAQSRGAYLSLDDTTGQWRPLKRWLRTRCRGLVDLLGPDLMLFGEWCYAIHSVHYTKLPAWFLAFDVYDRSRHEFWSGARRNTLAAQLDIATVPALGTGRFDLARLRVLLTASRLTEGPPEGIYVRTESDGRVIARAKLVRAGFTQAIEQHWSRKPLETNSLRADADRAQQWG
jgi:ATP-dependent RNA circularization protein (DNA/RNA ligase family)